ncbi:MAG: ABC transporter substrate-binding protein [Bacilli bacterium]|nr:ABC transporter substrate-binding protein [Bacilli bacterium]
MMSTKVELRRLFKPLFIILVMALSLLVTGCEFDRGEIDGIDPSKTQLYVGNYDGGLGGEWLRAVADKYEEEHDDIQIVIVPEKDLFSDANLLTNMPNYSNDIYFINAITYKNFVAQNRLADITDIVNSKVEGEDLTIKGKMNPTLAEYYETTDKKFYAVPFFDSLFGVVYDVDLFEDEGFYYNTDGKLIAFDSNTNLSAGPNGVSGDYDDGLPATYSEWENLVTELSNSGITPYIWTGHYEYYRQRFITSLWADYEGKENFDLNFRLKGDYTFKGDTNPTKITLENAYLLQKQPGKEYALNYVEHIIKNRLYSNSSFNTTNTHTMAQQEYLLSVVTNNRIAMIIEGGWWENEAKNFFSAMEKKYGEEYAFGERRFGFMPTPKADDGTSSTETTLISSTGNSVICINAKTTVLELAKDFLKFAHSEESLRTFTKYTGSVRPYQYQLTEEDLDQMSYYAKNMYELYTDENTKISYITLYYHDVFFDERTYLGTNWLWQSTIDKLTYVEPFYEFSQDSTLTASKYAKGLETTYSKSSWESKLGKYFGD